MQAMPQGVGIASEKDDGERWNAHPPVRLPLQVGSTAHWSLTRALFPLLFGGILIAAAIAIAIEDGMSDAGVWGFIAAPGALLVAYSAFHIYGAVVRRASDIVLDSRAIRVQGGVGGGVRIPWEELSPPYAWVEAGNERQLSALGIFKFFISGFWYGSPLTEVEVWKLRVQYGGQRRLLAKADREVEARSMEAAAQSIEAIEEGRRYVAESPAVPVRGLFCPSCGAATRPDDADSVPCGHCGFSVPVDESMRQRAAATKALADSRRRLSKITKRLLRQPGARATNVLLVALWGLMVASILSALALFHLYETYWVREMAWGLPMLLIWLVPPVVVLAACALGRAKLVRRGAMRVLTLGFGALAPAREGDAPRCRCCHGPLPDAGAGGVVQCSFCQSDNVTGIDLRPVVDRARAEQQDLGQVLRERRRAGYLWSGAAALALPALAASAAFVAASAHIILSVDGDARDVISEQSGREGDPEAPRVEDLESTFHEGPERVRVSGYLRNPNATGLRPPDMELHVYDDQGERLHTEPLDLFVPLPPRTRMPFVSSVDLDSDYERVEVDIDPDTLLRVRSPMTELNVVSHELEHDEEALTRPNELSLQVRNDTPWTFSSSTWVVLLKDGEGALVDVDYSDPLGDALGRGEEWSGSFELSYGERPPRDVEVLAFAEIRP